MINSKEPSLSYNFFILKAIEWQRWEGCSCSLVGWRCLNKCEMRGQIVSGAEGISQNLGRERGGLPGTPVERQKASICGSVAAEQLCPRARRQPSERRAGVTLSSADALQLEAADNGDANGPQTSLKDVEIERGGLNNSRRSICGTCHSTSTSHQSAQVCRGASYFWWRSTKVEPVWTRLRRTLPTRDGGGSNGKEMICLETLVMSCHVKQLLHAKPLFENFFVFILPHKLKAKRKVLKSWKSYSNWRN